MLVNRLAALHVPVLATHEPGGTPLGDQIRQLVLLRDDLSPWHGGPEEKLDIQARAGNPHACEANVGVKQEFR